MLNCKQASFLVSQSLDKKLSWGERMQLRIHLVICTACSRFRVQLGQIHKAIQRAVQDVEQNTHLELSIEARDRITDAVKSSKS